MTTTVCDLANQFYAADRRWSTGIEQNLILSDGTVAFIYCDTTGFEKILAIGGTALITAGDGRLIAEWKKWWAAGADKNCVPPVAIDDKTNINVAIINLRDNSVIFDAGPKQALHCLISGQVKAFTSGSGWEYAAYQLKTTGCAATSIKFAAQHDYCTGEDIDYTCSKTGKSNLSNSIYDYEKIVEGILNRGLIMKLGIDKPNDTGVPISEHPLKEEIRDLFTSGKAVASAPVPGLNKYQWTENTFERLDKALDKVHEIRAAHAD